MTKKERKQKELLFETAHRNLERDLIARAYSKVHDRARSEDIVQDTFMKTWLYLVRGGKIDVMRAFLYHVLNHLIVDEYRKRKTTSLDALLEKGFEPSTEREERLFDVMDGKTLLQLIEKLPKKYQAVVQMRFVDDLSLKEMSEITRQSKNTVAVQIHRGIEKLKSLSTLGRKP